MRQCSHSYRGTVSGNEEVDYRAELTKIYIVPLLRLQPGSTWSQPVDGQREASVTFGKVTTLTLLFRRFQSMSWHPLESQK